MRLVLLTPHAGRVYECVGGKYARLAEFVLIESLPMTPEEIEQIRTASYAGCATP
jgi:hypothetical protein